MANADCIIIQGSNMAECHPVGFQWVTEAKARGARVIHVDPRFTRTSAVSDKHLPIRAGSDIVLLGALINYVLSNNLWFHEYVVSYTNASTLISEDFEDAEDLNGLFSGYDPESGSYHLGSWAYETENSEGQDSRGEASDDAAGRGVDNHGVGVEHEHAKGAKQRAEAGGDKFGSGGAPVGGGA